MHPFAIPSLLTVGIPGFTDRPRGRTLTSGPRARGWGYRRLPRYRTVATAEGKVKRLQLHATRGWKYV